MPESVVDVAALYEALDAKRQSGKLSWRGLAHELEVTPSTFTRMAHGNRPDVDTFASILKWLEMPLDRFLEPSQSDSRADAMERIGTYLRMDRNLSPAAAESLERLIRVAYENLRSQVGKE